MMHLSVLRLPHLELLIAARKSVQLVAVSDLYLTMKHLAQGTRSPCSRVTGHRLW